MKLQGPAGTTTVAAAERYFKDVGGCSTTNDVVTASRVLLNLPYLSSGTSIWQRTKFRLRRGWSVAGLLHQRRTHPVQLRCSVLSLGRADAAMLACVIQHLNCRPSSGEGHRSLAGERSQKEKYLHRYERGKCQQHYPSSAPSTQSAACRFWGFDQASTQSDVKCSARRPRWLRAGSHLRPMPLATGQMSAWYTVSTDGGYEFLFNPIRAKINLRLCGCFSIAPPHCCKRA